MKLTIDDVEYPFPKIGTWSYDEAEQVLRVAKVTAGTVWQRLLEGDPAAHLGVAVVAFMRAHPDRDPMELRTGEGKTIDSAIVDLYADDAQTAAQKAAEASDDPPVEAGGDAGATPTASETKPEPTSSSG